MGGFGQLLRGAPRLLGFGFLLTFFSSFGQTFLLSLYVPELSAYLGLSQGWMGSLYATATLGSAALLSWVGRFIDYRDLRWYAWLTLGGYVVALLTLATTQHVVWAGLGLLGLRLTGQGLMGHISVTSMGRYFDAARGKAISLATLGFPAGEALLPLVIALLMEQVGWRGALVVSAVVLVAAVGPGIPLLLKGTNTAPPLLQAQKGDKQSAATHYGPRYFLRTRAFWVLAPNVFLLGFVNTAVFFFQVVLGEERGWSKEWVAGSLAAFAASSALSMFVSGSLVDRFTARRLFPFYFAPYVLGLVLVAVIQAPWVYPVGLLFMGLSNGMGSTIKSALQAELFGTRYLGTVRSLFTVLMVISTALGPVSFGALLDREVSFLAILLGCAMAVVGAILQSFRVKRITPFNF